MTQDNTEKIRVLIVDDIPETRENLRKLLYFETDVEIVGMASDGRNAIEAATKLQPHIVLMDINMPDMDGITASQEIGRVAPMSQVIMMSVQSEADYLRRSMLAGAVDFLTKPFSSEDLTSSIRRVHAMGVSRRVAAPAMVGRGDGTPAGLKGQPAPHSKAGKLLLIYSPKGGTGCSTIATNLAIALHQVTSQKVALVDTSLQFGDVDVLLNLQGQRSIADAASQVGHLDTVLLSALMSAHPSGIRVLAAPPSPEMAEAISVDIIKTILGVILQEFDYAVVDTWSKLDDIVLTTLDLADRVLVVMTPEIPSVKSAKQFLEIAEALQFPLERIDLILNKMMPRDGIRPEQLEGNIKHKILVRLDFDPKSARQATNQGLPLIVSEPKHPLSQAFITLAQQEVAALEPQLVPEVEEVVQPVKQEPSRRSGLFGRSRR
jgi:pilus assembly protein CpaE